MIHMQPSYLLYYLPLLVAISLVYGATRHEDPRKILTQSWHTAYWITSFLGIIFAIVWLLAIDQAWIVQWVGGLLLAVAAFVWVRRRMKKSTS